MPGYVTLVQVLLPTPDSGARRSSLGQDVAWGGDRLPADFRRKLKNRPRTYSSGAVDAIGQAIVILLRYRDTLDAQTLHERPLVECNLHTLGLDLERRMDIDVEAFAGRMLE